MKKCLALTALVLAALIAASCVLTAPAAKSQDGVAYSLRTISGSEDAARGIDVSVYNAGLNCLEWRTDYPVGGEPDTDFRFCFGGVHSIDYYRDTAVYLGTSLNSGVSSTSELTMEDIRSAGYGTSMLAGAIEDAITAAAGRSGTVRLRLRDYYEYYPLDIYVGLDNVFAGTPDGPVDARWGDDDYFKQALRRAFRIPVPEDGFLDVTLTYTAGVLTGISTEVENDGDIYISSSAVETTEGLYFAVQVSYSGERTEKPDTSLLPGGGEGIFFVPVRSEAGMRVLDETGLKNVYPFDVGEEFISLEADETALLIVHGANERVSLSVMDREKMEQLQSVPLGKGGEDVWYTRTLASDGLRVYIFSDNSFTAVSGRAGEYSAVLTGTMPETLYLDYQNADAAWDGSRLAIGSVMTFYEDEDGVRRNYTQYSTDFTLAVFSDEGTLFYGEYYSSLGTQSYPTQLPYGKCCRMMDFSLGFGRAV